MGCLVEADWAWRPQRGGGGGDIWVLLEDELASAVCCCCCCFLSLSYRIRTAWSRLGRRPVRLADDAAWLCGHRVWTSVASTCLASSSSSPPPCSFTRGVVLNLRCLALSLYNLSNVFDSCDRSSIALVPLPLLLPPPRLTMDDHAELAAL